MKIDALKPGDQVVIGSKRELADGSGGTICYVLAVGKFTTVRTPCGRGIVPHPGAYDRRVAVAEPVEHKRFNKDTREYERYIEWVPTLRDARSMMALSEWRIKNNVIKKQQREQQRYLKRGEELKRAAEAAVLKSVKAPPGARVNLYGYRRSGKDAELSEPAVVIRVKVADARKLEAVIAWLNWLQEPSPNECALP